MQLTLGEDDVLVLRDMLHDFLHELRLEVARTEAKDFRHRLLVRQDLLERLVARLEEEAKPASRA
jgi:hypothetical protein